MKKASKARRKKPVASKAAPGSAPNKQIAKPSRPWYLRSTIYAALTVLLGLAIYWPVLGGPFLFDDFNLMEPDSAIRAGTIGAALRSGRPVLTLSYTLNHRITGFDPFAFHLVNVLLHCLNAWLLWRLLGALLSRGILGDWASPAVVDGLRFGIPLLFLASPIQTESVAYISSRSEVLAGTFYLAALWAFASPLREKNRWLLMVLILVLFAGAAGCKQDKLTLPAAILLLDLVLLSRFDWRGLKQSWPTYGVFLVGLIAGFFVLVEPFLLQMSAGFSLPWQPYLFTQFRMYFLYLRLLAAPIGLNADYDIVPSETLGEQGAWIALLGLLAIVGAALWYRKRAPAAVFGVLFFFLVLGPSSSIYPIADYAAERRLYLPSVGFFVAAGVGAAWLLRRTPGGLRSALLIVLVLYSAGTFQRSRVWADELAFWTDAAEKSPGKVRVLEWLGRIHTERGDHEKAIEIWDRAVANIEKDDPKRGFLLANLGVAHAKQKKWEDAASYYRRALRIQPRRAEFWAQLAVAQIRLGREEEGWESFDKGAPFARNSTPFFQLRGQEHYLAERYGPAARDFRRAADLQPDNLDLQNNLQAAENMLARQRAEQRLRRARREPRKQSPDQEAEP